MKILIVDDDPISLKVIKVNLIKWGYEVQLASGGEEAWEIVQGANPPRMIILDWMMKPVDGIEICKRIREDDEKRKTYIILLSAKADKASVSQGLEAGADDYITKPFDREELRARVRAAERMIELVDEAEEKAHELRELRKFKKEILELMAEKEAAKAKK
ncbi:response regulator [Oligoflexia bacterium]|nr:response regulator [Oligoflexia bacterium]